MTKSEAAASAGLCSFLRHPQFKASQADFWQISDREENNNNNNININNNNINNNNINNNNNNTSQQPLQEQ